MDSKNNCYICWFLTITLSVTTGSLLADGIRITVAAISINSYLETQTPKLQIPTPIPAIPATPSTSSDPPVKKQKSGLETALKTCEYWKSQYLKDHSSSSKAYMDSACLRVKEYR